MNLREIREECWSQAEERGVYEDDRLWTMTDMNRYINRVYRFIARETLCIVDSTTPATCQIASEVVPYTSYEEGTLDYLWANSPDSWLYQRDVCPYLFPLHKNILRIDEVKWAKRCWKLYKVSAQKWQSNPYWERTIGMPTEYATDLSSNMIALNFRDTVDDTLLLQVRRLPMEPLVDDDDVPEFKEHYHDFFVNGVLHLMYQRQDVESFDQRISQEYKALFAQDIDEIKQKESMLDRRLQANYSMSAFR